MSMKKFYPLWARDQILHSVLKGELRTVFFRAYTKGEGNWALPKFIGSKDFLSKFLEIKALQAYNIHTPPRDIFNVSNVNQGL